MRSVVSFLTRSQDLRRFGFGLVWSTLGTVIVRLTPLVTTILVSRWFGVDAVGKFGLVYGSLVSASLLASAGVALMATRNVAALAESDPDTAGKLAGMSLMLAAASGLILGVAVFAFAGPIAESVLRQPAIEPYLRVVAPVMVLTAVNQVQGGILGGLQQFKTIARLNLICGTAMILAVPGGLYLGGLMGCFIALGVATLLQCVLTQPAVKSALTAAGIRLTYRGAFGEWRLVTGFAVPALLASILFEPVNFICTAIVANNANGLTEVGTYYIAMQLETLLLFVPQVVVQVVIPMLSTGFGTRDRKRVLTVLGAGMGANALIAIGFVGFMWLFGEWFLSIYKLEAARHWDVIWVVVLASAMIAVALPLGQVPVSSGYMWTGLAITAGWATIFMTGTYLLQDMGAMGLVIARAIAWGVQTVVYVLFTPFAIARTSGPAPAAAPPASRAAPAPAE